MAGERFNRMRSRSDHVHLLLMLMGILTICLWLVAAGGVGSQQASAQQQYESAVPGNGDGNDGGTPGDGGYIPSDGGYTPSDGDTGGGTPTDGDGDTNAGDNQCSGDVTSVDPVLEKWAT